MAQYLVARLREKQKASEAIVSLTAYDYFTALIAREADVDFVLVGDSLGNVVQGASTTVPVTLEQVVYHTRIVATHFPAERVVLDMPFGTFKLEARETARNAIRAFQDSGCGAVKFEGATNDNLLAVQFLADAGVPVVGHLGLLPQRVHSEGGYRMQGRTPEQAERILRDAVALEKAGAVAVVLELVEPSAARRITDALSIPTIGIGCGQHDGRPSTAGQIIVVHDILGMLPGNVPSFVKKYADIYSIAADAVASYRDDVHAGSFPAAEALRETAGRGRERR